VTESPVFRLLHRSLEGTASIPTAPFRVIAAGIAAFYDDLCSFFVNWQ
jgi:hypothetical protein